MTSGATGIGFYIDCPGQEPLKNEAFLESYVRYTAWLRLVSAWEQLQILGRQDIEVMRKLSAIADFYQQAGMLLEDLACFAVALMAISGNSDLLMADVLSRIVLLSEKASPINDVDTCISKLCAGGPGTVRINRISFFEESGSLGGQRCLGLMGLKWSRKPSVKTVEKVHMDLWMYLPTSIEFLVHLFTHRGPQAITKTLNKIKHGPQIDIIDLKRHLNLMLRGDGASSMDAVFAERALSPETLRVLFKGATLACSANEESVPALFLEDKVEALKPLLYMMLYPSVLGLWTAANFFRKRWYSAAWIDAPPIVQEMDRQRREARDRNMRLASRNS